MNAKPEVQGPAWNLSDEYAQIAAIEPDLAAVDDALAQAQPLGEQLAQACEAFSGNAVGKADEQAATLAARLFALSETVQRLCGNISTYASCRLSADADDAEALDLQGRLQAYHKRIAAVFAPLQRFIALADDDTIAAYLRDPAAAASAFTVHHARRRRHEQLSLKEENIVSGLSQDGIHAWGRLYTQLSGTLQCDVVLPEGGQRLGIAQASGLMQKPDVSVREAAWRGINATWQSQQESCAAAINAISGWRLEMLRHRSSQQQCHYLDAPLHASRIERDTLTAIMDVSERFKGVAQRAARAMAKSSGREQLGPWDLRAPSPITDAERAPLPFDDAVTLIANAYGDVDPALGEFVEMMVERRWIEGTVTARKRPGAYCTRFARSSNPRVYMTYAGSSSDVITLAHELGHAWHGWVMRDLPDSQRSYGMSLAETASTFGETVVRDAMYERAATPEQQIEILWEETAALVTFLLNIPVRFVFEERLYEARQQRPLRARELCDLMSEAWGEWYGDTMSETDPWFWASKLHFYISGISFYNFPYLFGYLFSLGVYRRREQIGCSFFARYNELLRDTGRMSAEDVAATHLDADLTSPGFWRDTLTYLETRVERFESLTRSQTGE